MTKAVQIFPMVILLVFVGFVAWMNLTPGHFQGTQCSCEVKYLPKSYNPEGIFCARLCHPNLFTGLKEISLLLLANLDFNK